jgi:hypothetical protein
VHWQGYESSDDTWEPFEHLANSQALLQQYITTQGRQWTHLLPLLPTLCARTDEFNYIILSAPPTSELDLTTPLSTRLGRTLYPWLAFIDYASWIPTSQEGVLLPSPASATQATRAPLHTTVTSSFPTR